MHLKTLGAAALAAVAIGAAPALAEPPVTTFDLDNGLEVVVIEDHRAPVVTHMVWYRVGSADEVRGKSGVAHFLEHLMFKGTDEIPDGAFSKLVAAQGGQDNAFTSYDYTGYFQRIAADRLPIVMKMEADRMRDLRITDENVRTERDVILEERNSRTDNSPDALFSEQMNAAQYLNHAYGVPVIGWRREMEQLSRADALEWYRRYYAPDNAILVVAGDVTPDRVRALAEEYYGPLEPSNNPPDARPQEPPQLAARRLQMADPRVGQDYVSRSYLVPGYDPENPKESAALDMLAAVLGNGVASRLSQSLQIDQGIAIGTGAWYTPMSHDATTLMVYGVPAEGHSLDEIEAAIDAELAKMAASGPTEEELARAKRVADASRIFAEDSQSGLARLYGAALAMGFDVEDVRRWPEVVELGHRRGRPPGCGRLHPARDLGDRPADARPLTRSDARRGEELMSIRSLFRAAALSVGVASVVALPAAADVDIQQLTSPGGQDFWLVEEHAIPIVSLEMGFHGGSRLDPADKAGLAEFTMALMNEGAGDLDAVAFSNRADDISARLGFDAKRDAVQVSGQFLTETLDEGTELLATALAAPRFDPEPVARVRGQILSGIAQSENDPGDVAGKEWFARAFPNHPYGTPQSGTRESVAEIDVADLRAAEKELMTRANANIAIVGDVGPERAGRLVDRLVAGLPEGEAVTADRAETLPPPGIHVVEQDVPQSVAVFGHEGIVRDDPDFIPAYVMNYILGGGGFTSRLTEEVREKRGLAYSVYSYLTEMDSAALYMGGVQTANERIAESIDLIRAEWARMAEDGITPEELDKAKTYLTGSFPLQFDSNAKIADYLVFVMMENLGADYINRRNDLIEAVTLEDVNRVARRLLKPDALSVVVVGEPVGLNAGQ